MKRRLYMVAANTRYGRNAFLPLIGGLLWGYARQFPEIADAYELGGMLYLKEPIADAIARIEDPSICCFSSYIWNHEWNKQLATAIKAKWPSCATLVGGVQVPEESPAVLQECAAFDFAIYGEGEGAFADFLREHDKEKPNYDTVGSLVWKDGSLRSILTGSVIGHSIVVNPRHTETPLESIPSPYLEGLFDEIVKDDRWTWNMLAESNRGCPYASFAGDTYVTLPDRILRFDEESYTQTDTLACPDSSHNHRLGVDDRLVSQGLRECTRFSFANGLFLSVTPTHPMLVVRDEVIVDAKANEICVGDWIPVEIGQNKITGYVPLGEPSKTKWELLAAKGIGQGRRVPDPIDLPKVLNEKVAWLTGYLIGDGCLPSDNRASFHLAVKDRSRAMLTSLVPDLFGIPLKITDSTQTKKMQHGQVDSRKVVQFFRESLGIQSLEEKLTVPRTIFHSPPTVVRAFLEGLWCADGYTPPNGESYVSTISKKLAEECAMLLYWIGDTAVVRKLKQRSNLSERPFYYRVEWHASTCRERIYGVPCTASRVPAIRHTYTDSRTGELRLRHTIPKDKANRVGSPRATLRYFEPKHPLLDPRFVYTQVTAIESIGKVETYDIHHHPEHKVSANGVFVRQCSFCAWGVSSLDKLRQFPMERIVAEFEWMAKNKCEVFYSCDANLGIIKRDVDTMATIVKVKEVHGYPRKVRAAFAKNSNDVVFDISKKLSDAGMLKATTLALQSMKDDTLVSIQRKNIKYDKLAELSARYEAAGIATYVELIVGLPGETLESFITGIDRVLDAGQHEGLSIYLCMLLNNTEMAKPEYRAAHRIESVPMKALLYHGTPEPGVVEEIQETVVATATMPAANLKRAVLYGWLVQALHSFGLTQHMARKLRAGDIYYSTFYLEMLDWALAQPRTILGQEVARLSELWDAAVRGESWATVDLRFGDVSWPPEELLVLRLAVASDRFYDELALNGFMVVKQRALFIPPAPDKLEEWAREAVWFGRKGQGRKLRLREQP